MSIQSAPVIAGLSEPEIERLMRVAGWAYNQGRNFVAKPVMLEMFTEIDWKKPVANSLLCINCIAVLQEAMKDG